MRVGGDGLFVKVDPASWQLLSESCLSDESAVESGMTIRYGNFVELSLLKHPPNMILVTLHVNKLSLGLICSQSPPKLVFLLGGHLVSVFCDDSYMTVSDVVV